MRLGRARGGRDLPGRLLPGERPGRLALDDRGLFVLATVLMGLGSCVNAAAFNNYLKDALSLDIARRTFLEFPRELPGFLVTFLVGALVVLGEVRIALVANLAAAAGTLALGWIPSSFVLVIGSVFVLSVGQHLYMPLGNAIGMGFAADGEEGSVLGKIQSANTIALVAGAGVLLLLFAFAGLTYRAAFTIGSAFYLLSALAFLAMSPRRAARTPRRFVLRREYGRYYALSILYGARKQFFITFGPWLIVDYFRQPVATMTLLFFIVSIIGIWAQPFVGRLTDRFGPKKVLGGESLVMVAACCVYAFAPELLPAGPALVVVSACYLVDQAANAVSMTRAVYAKRLVERVAKGGGKSPRNAARGTTAAAELSPTLSMSVSIDHLVSMSIPTLGGLVWRGGGAAGYRWVFLAGALVAAANYAVTRGIEDEGAAGAGQQDGGIGAAGGNDDAGAAGAAGAEP